MNLLHLYTGDGKGKTTAAMGLALRALGHGHKVLIAQFLKTGRSGELEALRHLPGALVFEADPIQKFTSRMTPAELKAASLQQDAEISRLLELVKAEKPFLCVFDELALAAACGLVTEAHARELVDTALTFSEVAVTGRDAPEFIRARADYVSEIVKRKHPFDRGIRAREGVEW